MGTINPSVFSPPLPYASIPPNLSLRRSARPRRQTTVTNPTSPLLDSEGDANPDLRDYDDSSDSDDSRDDWKPEEQKPQGAQNIMGWNGPAGTPLKSVRDIKGKNGTRVTASRSDSDDESLSSCSDLGDVKPLKPSATSTDSHRPRKQRVNRFIPDHPQMIRSKPEYFKNTLPLLFTLADPPIYHAEYDSSVNSDLPKDRMDRNHFNQVFHEFMLSLSEQKRFKSTVNRPLARIIVRCLLKPKDTDIGRPQFRHWVRNMFKLKLDLRGAGDREGDDNGEGVEEDEEMKGYYLEHDGRRVVMQEEMWEALTKAHEDCYHGGRDRTMAEVRKRWAYLPKELVARFVAVCPGCDKHRKPSNRTASFSSVKPKLKSKPKTKVKREKKAPEIEEQDSILMQEITSPTFSVQDYGEVGKAQMLEGIDTRAPAHRLRHRKGAPIPQDMMDLDLGGVNAALGMGGEGQPMPRSRTEGGMPLSFRSHFHSGSVPNTPVGEITHGFSDIDPSLLSPVQSGHPLLEQHFPTFSSRAPGRPRPEPLQLKYGMGYGHDHPEVEGGRGYYQLEGEDMNDRGPVASGSGLGWEQQYIGENAIPLPEIDAYYQEYHEQQQSQYEGDHTPTSQVIPYGYPHSVQSTPMASSLVPPEFGMSRRGSTQTDFTVASGSLYTPHTHMDLDFMNAGTGEMDVMNMTIFEDDEQPDYGMNLFPGGGSAVPAEQKGVSGGYETGTGLGLDIGQPNFPMDPVLLAASFQADNSNEQRSVSGLAPHADPAMMLSPDIRAGAVLGSQDLQGGYYAQHTDSQLQMDSPVGPSHAVDLQAGTPCTPMGRGDPYAGLWSPSPVMPTSPRPRTQQRMAARQAHRASPYTSPISRRGTPRFPDNIYSPERHREFTFGSLMSPSANFQPFAYSEQAAAYHTDSVSGNTGQDDRSHQLQDQAFVDQIRQLQDQALVTHNHPPQTEALSGHGHHPHSPALMQPGHESTDVRRVLVPAFNTSGDADSASGIPQHGASFCSNAVAVGQQQWWDDNVRQALDQADPDLGRDHPHTSSMSMYANQYLPASSSGNEAVPEFANDSSDLSELSSLANHASVDGHQQMSHIQSGSQDNNTVGGSSNVAGQAALWSLPCTPNPSNEVKETEGGVQTS